jgi:hypothetical protein
MFCELHQQEVDYVEKHHLEPRTRRGGKKRGPFIRVCSACAHQLHEIFTIKELQKEYNTLEKLLANEKVQKWIEWIRNKKDLSVCMKRKKKRR